MPQPETQQLSIFDLDRTLTQSGTWSPFLLFAARRLAPWRLVLVPAALVLMLGYKAGLMSRKALKERMQAVMLGRRVFRARIATIVNSYADHCLRKGVYTEGIALMGAEQAAGRTVIIASAAFSYYLAAISERLGVAHVGTCSCWNGDDLLARIEGENCYGPAKLRMIEAFMAERAIDRASTHVRFYSDDLSDLPTFEWADEAVVVNPSARLARHAAGAGWPILDWRASRKAATASGSRNSQNLQLGTGARAGAITP